MREREGVWGSIAQRDHIHVRVVRDLPGEVGGGALVRRPDGRVWILLAAELTARERRAVLAHELVHLERGTVRCDDAPPGWAAVVAREEARVDRIVAEWLVPVAALRTFADQRISLDEAVDAADVAEAFDVPLWVAGLACDALTGAPPVTTNP